MLKKPCDLKVHLVWATRDCQPLLQQEEIALRIHELLQEACEKLGVEILESSIKKDHVVLSLSYSSQTSVSKIAHNLKVETSFRLLKEHEELRKILGSRSLWAKGYLAASAESTPFTEDDVTEFLTLYKIKEF